MSKKNTVLWLMLVALVLVLSSSSFSPAFAGEKEVFVSCQEGESVPSRLAAKYHLKKEFGRNFRILSLRRIRTYQRGVIKTRFGERETRKYGCK